MGFNNFIYRQNLIYQKCEAVQGLKHIKRDVTNRSIRFKKTEYRLELLCGVMFENRSASKGAPMNVAYKSDRAY